MSCPICGMPPGGDGEPCCTRAYAVKVVRQQDATIRALRARVEELENNPPTSGGKKGDRP